MSLCKPQSHPSGCYCIANAHEPSPLPTRGLHQTVIIRIYLCQFIAFVVLHLGLQCLYVMQIVELTKMVSNQVVDWDLIFCYVCLASLLL